MTIDPDKTLRRKLGALFPEPNLRDQVETILNSYGTEAYEREPVRVRLAILKLSGADQNEIKKMTAVAKQDYRDVLAWAEYPRQIKAGVLPEGPDKRVIIAADRAEYESWLQH